MTPTEQIVWTSVAGLVVTLLAGAVHFVFSRFTERKTDRVQLTAKLSSHGDVETIQEFGCPGLLLTLKCAGKRTAKIRNASISTPISKEDLAGLEAGFEMSLGQSDNPAIPSPSLEIELIPISKQNSENGFVLERDDIAQFFLPLAVSGIGLFASAKSQDVKIDVAYFDGEAETVIRGVEIQEKIRTVADVYRGLEMRMLKKIKMSINVNAEEKLEALDYLGKVNSKTAWVGDRVLDEPLTDPQRKRCLAIADEIWNTWGKKKCNDIAIVPSKDFSSSNVDEARTVSFGIGVTHPMHTLSLIELLETISLLNQICVASREADPNADKMEVQLVTPGSYTYSKVTELLRTLPISNAPLQTQSDHD